MLGLLIIIFIIYLTIDIIIFNKTTYHTITKNDYFKTLYDDGKHGEYLIYHKLKKYEKEGWKFLFNVYIPKENEETSEIDVLLISKYGLFVFESKNYSGWIFGNENSYYWTQCLPQGEGRKALKTKFYNPILQNKTHIKYLQKILDKEINIASVITFSNRCELKKVNYTSKYVYVVNRNNIQLLINKIIEGQQPSLTQEEVEEIYNKLYPLSQMTEEEKQKHISDINNKYRNHN